jgi:hypothetical protein
MALDRVEMDKGRSQKLLVQLRKEIRIGMATRGSVVEV